MRAVTDEQLKEIERQMALAKVFLVFLKHVPLIIGVLAAISLALAVFDFIAQIYGWAIVNLILGLAGMSLIARAIKAHL